MTDSINGWTNNLWLLPVDGLTGIVTILLSKHQINNFWVLPVDVQSGILRVLSSSRNRTTTFRLFLWWSNKNVTSLDHYLDWTRKFTQAGSYGGEPLRAGSGPMSSELLDCQMTRTWRSLLKNWVPSWKPSCHLPCYQLHQTASVRHQIISTKVTKPPPVAGVSTKCCYRSAAATHVPVCPAYIHCSFYVLRRKILRMSFVILQFNKAYSFSLHLE